MLPADLEDRLRAASEELDRGRATSVTRMALALLGGGLLLAGLILIIAENWEALPRAVKLGGWALLQVGFVAATAQLGRRSSERRYLSEGFAFLSGGWVLAGIALVSQIYHLNARLPNGIWFWLALVLPMVWAVERRMVTLVIFAAVTAGLILEVVQRGSWIEATRVESPWLWLAIPLAGAASISWLPHPVASLRSWVGAWTFIVGNFFLLVLGSTKELDRSDLGGAWAVAAAGLGAALAFPRRILPAAWDPATGRIILIVILTPWALLGAQYDSGTIKDELALGVSWIAQLAVAVLVIRTGAREGSSAWVNLGYLALLAGILTRYFDFFGVFLEGGAALALTGILLLFVLHVLERARRKTLAGGGIS